MRIGIVSDIHCDAAALTAALQGMDDVDEVFCCGDLVFDYRFSNEVVQIVQETGMRLVLGNHDAGVLAPSGSNLRASGRCDPENLRFLEQTPETVRVQLAGKTVLMVHGSPWDPLREYMFPSSAKLAKLPETGADYVLMGHTHYPMVRRIDGVTAINPGSAGDPRDPSNGRKPTYAVLDVASGDCEIRTIPDLDRAVAGT